jgi:hypothetical protein
VGPATPARAGAAKGTKKTKAHAEIKSPRVTKTKVKRKAIVVPPIEAVLVDEFDGIPKCVVSVATLQDGTPGHTRFAVIATALQHGNS